MNRPPSPDAVDDTGGFARVVHRSRVQWSDTDAGGHHHNTAIVRFVEAAEAALMRERGVAGYFGAAPRVRHEVNFVSPLWFGQEVTTDLSVEHIGTSSMTFRFAVWGEETDRQPRRLAASGRYIVVHVLPGGEPTSAPWPKEWMTALRNHTQSESTCRCHSTQQERT
ncbi:acyl-CoA thioesterase [Streptomyces sp. NA02950]|uniref:acyl-CoA thioesterase n=1 Tax=Streptomyces sp. NA02950 TaxID=2742137 RepID=UPI001592100D|nr:thioesterase family protein [Streptomyces sp. NA02950]QKV97059.1 acyl-CoA thioesterase [Streptomyces sp. NA02950]